MREIMVKEFAEMVKGGLYDITSIDSFGIFIALNEAGISYDEDSNNIIFLSGASEKVTGEISFDIDEAINKIYIDETNDTFTIEFSQRMSDVEIKKTVLQDDLKYAQSKSLAGVKTFKVFVVSVCNIQHDVVIDVYRHEAFKGLYKALESKQWTKNNKAP